MNAQVGVRKQGGMTAIKFIITTGSAQETADQVCSRGRGRGRGWLCVVLKANCGPNAK
jgi:hypothetical protein